MTVLHSMQREKFIARYGKAAEQRRQADAARAIQMQEQDAARAAALKRMQASQPPTQAQRLAGQYGRRNRARGGR